MLTIRARLGRGTRSPLVLSSCRSFRPTILLPPLLSSSSSSSSFSPFPRRKRLSLNYERDTVKFCGADKGAIQIKRSPFPPLPALVLFYLHLSPPYRHHPPPPPHHRSSLRLLTAAPSPSPPPSQRLFRRPSSLFSRLFRPDVAFRSAFLFLGFLAHATHPPSLPQLNLPLSLLRPTYKNNTAEE